MASFHHRARAVFLAIMLAFMLAGSFAQCASAVQLNTGDIVISADIGWTPTGEDYGLMRVDPVTGDRTIISDAMHGSGPQFTIPIGATCGVSRMAGGDLLVSATNGLFTVDPATGDRTQINSLRTWDAVQVGGQIYAVDGSELFRVDPNTGNRTNLAPDYNNASALVYADGNLFLGLHSYSLSGDFVANYAPEYADYYPIASMAATPDGSVLFGSVAGNAIAVTVGSVNPNVPAPFDYHSLSSGGETSLFIVAGLGVASNGTIWATNILGIQSQSNFVLGIAPTTGNVTTLSDTTHGAGPTFLYPYGLAVVPEPGTFVLAALGSLALLALRRRTDGFHHHAGRILLAITLAVTLVGPFAQCASAVQLNTGDIVISADIGPTAGGEDYGLMRVDPVTGDRTIISDATHGSGPQFNISLGDGSGVSRMAGGDLLVSASNGLFSVDPATGDRTQINSRSTSDAIQVGNQIYAVDGANLFRVDPTTGNTTNLAPDHSNANALVYADGNLFVGLESYSLSGDPFTAYGFDQGITALAATPDGKVIFSGGPEGVLVGSVNPNVPDPFDYRSIASGTGAPLVLVTGLGVAPSGTVWAANDFLGGRQPGTVVGIDPTTGNRTLLSDATHGTGPDFINPYGLTVVPEPGTFVLAAFGGLALLVLRRRTDGFHHQARKIFLAITLAVTLVESFAQCASAVQLSAGDIVISADIGPTTGGEDYGLIRVDPATGDRTIISDATHGSGPAFDFNQGATGGPPAGVSRMAGGDLLVSASNGLFEVDPTSGNRTMINSRPTSDAIQVGNQIYAVDLDTLFRVDPTTGNTTNLAFLLGGSSAALTFANGNLYTPILQGAYSYSLSGAPLTGYPGFVFSSSITTTPEGTLILGGASPVINGGGAFAKSFNPNIPSPYDAHALITGSPGFQIFDITGLGVSPNGTIWAANLVPSTGSMFGNVFGIDPTTGNVAILSDDTHGGGPTFVAPYGLTVVPEPGTFVLAAFGGLALLALRRRTDGFHLRVGRILLAITLAVTLVGSFARCASAVQLSAGDIVISADIGRTAAGEDYGLMRIDPVTGERTIISDMTHGSGPKFDFTLPDDGLGVWGVSRMTGGDLLVSASNGLFEVDPTTGNRAMITSRPVADAIQVGNEIYAIDGSNLFRVDPSTGNSTNLAIVGALAGGVTYLDGKLFYPGPGTINSYSLSGSTVTSILPADNVLSIAAAPDGTLLLGSVTRILNPISVGSFNPNVPDPFDSRALALGYGQPDDVTLDSITGMGVAPSGTVWAANVFIGGKPPGTVVGIDPTTGNRTLLSDATHGAGPTFVAPYGLTVVPEPGTFVLAALGGLALLALRRRTDGFHHRAGTLFLAITLAIFLVGSFAQCASAVQLNTGDIVISADISRTAGGEDYGLMRVDPVTGDRTIISDMTHGSGPQLDFSELGISSVSRMAGGQLLVSAENGLFSVNPATGDRTTINTRPTAGAIQVGNQIYAVDGENLFRVDPTTGNSTNLGLDYGATYSLAFANGELYTPIRGGVISYSLSGDYLASFPSFEFTGAMIATSDGNLIMGSASLILNGGTASVVSLNPNIPDPTYLDLHGLPAGVTSINTVTGLGVSPSGTVWVANIFFPPKPAGEVLGIDPTTGAVTKLSDSTHGAGPTFVVPYGLAVVPEPGSFVLTIIAGVSLIALRRKK